MRGSAVFRTGIAPGGALAGPWVRNPLWTRARAVPSLDLRFADNKSLTDAVTGASLVTFTRASSGTFVGSDGVLRSARTNYIRNNTGVGAVAGTPGTLPTNWSIFTSLTGLTRQIVGAGTEDGIAYIDFRLSGTPSAAGNYFLQTETNTSTAASNGQTWTSSVYAKLAAGSLAGISSIKLSTSNRDSGGNVIAAGDTTFTPTSSTLNTQRVVNTYTNASASTAYELSFLTFALSGAAVDFTIRIGLPQLELSSTVGEAINTTGTINSAPRFDHSPTTGESLGLLVEEARTNSVTNNTMVGAVAGTPGTNPTGWTFATAQSNGLTISIVGTGVENGINYIDYRFNGTTVASPNACAFGFTNAAAATSQTWTSSLYWKLASGATTGTINWQLGIIENTAVGTFVTGAFYTQTTPTSAALITQRPTATRTLSGGVTVGQVSHTMNITVAGNTAIDFTIRMGLPQLEQGAFATSVIPTTTAAATRSADVASITGSAFSGWYRQDEGTVFAECAVTQPASGGNQFVFRANDNSFNNNTTLNIQGSGFASIATAAGGVFDGAAANVLALSANTAAKFAGAYAANNLGVSLNGATAVTDTSATMPTALNRLDIGSDHIGANRVKAGTMRRLTYWPARLPNSTLQTLTQ